MSPVVHQVEYFDGPANTLTDSDRCLDTITDRVRCVWSQFDRITPYDDSNGPDQRLDFVYLAEQNVTGWEGGVSKTSRVRYGYDAYGNQEVQYDDGDISTGVDGRTVWRNYVHTDVAGST